MPRAALHVHGYRKTVVLAARCYYSASNAAGTILRARLRRRSKEAVANAEISKEKHPNTSSLCPIWSRRNQRFSTRSHRRAGKEPTITRSRNSSSGTAPSRDWRSTGLSFCVTGSVSNRDATINLRLAAVRRIAYEAADSGLLSPELAAGIRRVKGVRRLGVRVGNWLTAEQGERLLDATSKPRKNKNAFS
jgi:hypothetical protein